MDRTLVKKILGAEYFVKLEDTIYNLREITDEIRESLLFTQDVFHDRKIYERTEYELEASLKVAKELHEKLKDPNFISGYTNSKDYLKKYIYSISNDIEGIQKAMLTSDEKLLLHHNNMLCDLILKY